MREQIAMSSEVMVSAPKVEKFTPWPKCSACGEHRAGVRGWWVWLAHGAHYTRVNLSYCPGNKPPTEMHGNPNPLAALLGRELPQHEATYPCAGIDRPHLHVICRMCSYHWMMEVWKP